MNGYIEDGAKTNDKEAHVLAWPPSYLIYLGRYGDDGSNFRITHSEWPKLSPSFHSALRPTFLNWAPETCPLAPIVS
jgi:hypothetical protein